MGTKIVGSDRNFDKKCFVARNLGDSRKIGRTGRSLLKVENDGRLRLRFTYESKRYADWAT